MPWAPILVIMMGSLRAIGVVLALPTVGGHPLPPMLRAALAFMLGGLLASVTPNAAVPPTEALVGLAGAAMHEVLLGLAMGLTIRMVLSGAELAGRLISGEVGLIAAPGFDVPIPAQEPLPSFMGFFAGLMFFALHAHEQVLAAFARSFVIAPPGLGGLNPHAAETLMGGLAELMELALRMAAPFIALNFVITFAFAILGRAVPKMNVFILSGALRTLLGMTLLAGAGALFTRYLSGAFDRLPWALLELVAHR
jgi:flagellar biosynthetic protein FliR